MLDPLLSFFIYYLEAIIFGGAILFALVYFLLGKHRRKDEPTYDFPQDEASAYKPIVTPSPVNPAKPGSLKMSGDWTKKIDSRSESAKKSSD